MTCHNYLAYPFEHYAQSRVRYDFVPETKSTYFKNSGLYIDNPQFRWNIIGHVSDGHDGNQVFKVRDILTHEQFALKSITKKSVKKLHIRDMVKMEIGSSMEIASATLKDPKVGQYLCQMRSFWETDDLILILMDFCEGKTMGDEHWEY